MAGEDTIAEGQWSDVNLVDPYRVKIEAISVYVSEVVPLLLL